MLVCEVYKAGLRKVYIYWVRLRASEIIYRWVSFSWWTKKSLNATAKRVNK